MLHRKRRNMQYVRFGELFTESGIVPIDALNHSLLIAKRAQMPIGRVLVMSGFVSERDVDCALEAQQLVKVGRTPRDMISQILRMAHTGGVTVEEALAIHDVELAFCVPTTHVGRMLIAACVFTEAQILQATRQSALEKISLGRHLMNDLHLSSQVLAAALNLQILCRDRRLTRLQATAVLRYVASEDVSLAKALTDFKLDDLLESDQPRLGDLLLAAGVLPPEAINDALELSLESNNKIGEVLTAVGYLPTYLLESALHLQEMVNTRTIRISRALELLRLVHELGVHVERILDELDRLSQVVNFIRTAGLIDEKKLRFIVAHQPEYYENPARVLTEQGLIDLKLLEKASECMSYFRTNRLSEENACATLKYAAQQGIEPKEALLHLNWQTDVFPDDYIEESAA